METLLTIDIPLWIFSLLIFCGFVAGYFDAIAGGGGMIQALALLLAGIPPISVLATNKFSSVTGTITAVIKYAHGKVINWYLVSACLIPCLLAAGLGSKLVMYLSNSVITWLIIICIPIAFCMMFIRHNKNQEMKESRSRLKAITLLSPIAFYDGLIGPGTGTYMAIAANKGLGMGFLRATGLAKPLNLATNLGSVFVYILAGKVFWSIAIPMAIANALGAYIGSRSAMKYGDGFIKKVMIVMLTAMLLFTLGKHLFF